MSSPDLLGEDAINSRLFPIFIGAFQGVTVTQTSVPAPSVKLTSFACPHCGAHATQTWFLTRLEQCSSENPTPTTPPLEKIKQAEADVKDISNEQARAPIMEATQHFRRVLLGESFIGYHRETLYNASPLENIFVSLCYTCDQTAIWLHDRLLYPSKMTGPAPNPDLSEDVLHDFEEARTILDLSPRGAASLLRLAIEKICIELKAEGNDINQQIAFLVSKGLPEEVQQALDTIRVIGNEAVHPGQLDLRDDRETATKLFDLVNFIAQDRISRPKQIKALYGMIPEGKRKAIDVRNAKAIGGQ